MRDRFLYFLLFALVLVPFRFVSAQQRGPSRVIVARAVSKDVGEPQTFVGTMDAVRISTVGSAVPGRIENLFVKEGQRVKRGDPLAKVRTRIIEARVAAAKASLRMRKAELEEMEAGPRTEEIAEVKARLESAKVMQAMRSKRYNRARNLILREGAISQEEFEEIEAQSAAADATVRETIASLQLLEAGYRKERIARARALYEEQIAVVEELEEMERRHTMVAPFDGYVLLDHAEEGQWVLQSTLIARVAEMDQMDVMASVPEDFISRIHVGDSADVFVSAISEETIRNVPKEELARVGVFRGQKFYFYGTVTAILPAGDPQARTFPVKVRVKNVLLGDGVLLKSGMFTRVQFSVGRKTPAILVPKDAVVLGGRTPQVYVVRTEGGDAIKGKVDAVDVTLGVSSGMWIQVKGDVSKGNWIVVQGNERLRPGQEVIGETAKTPIPAP